MRNRLAIALAIAAGAGAAATANAIVISNWTFETSIPATAGPFAAELGANAASSFATGVHVSSATAYSSPAGNGSTHSFSSNTWAVGDYYQFTTSTTGYSGISIQWDQTSSNTGPRDIDLQWSTDGSTFSSMGGPITVLANLAVPGFWNATTSFAAYTEGPFAGPAALDNQATVYFRLRLATTTSANGGTIGTGGTSRVDNVIISAVPAPGAVALLGVGGLIAARRRRA